MSRARNAASLVLVILGYALLIPGQLATVYLDKALIWTAVQFGAAGRWAINLTWQSFPPGAFLAVVVILAGALLIAFGIAMGSAPVVARAFAAPDGRGRPARPAPVVVLLVVAAGLAGATLYICRMPQPSNLALAPWGISMLCGAAAFLWLDRAWGTTPVWAHVRRREMLTVVVLGLLSLAVVAHDLMSWRWSGTPDETHFFGVAKAMVDGTSKRFFLSERGVFEVHPTLSSVYQSAFMMVLGISGFAWRLSSAAALAASVPLLYVVARRLWNGRVATIAALLFGTTPVAVGFAHLGYNNSQIYPVVIGSLALLLWAHACRSAGLMYLAGCLAGLAFYTYYPARLTLALVVVLGACIGALPLWRAGRMRTAALTAGFALAVVPVTAYPLQTLGRMFQFTRFTSGGTLRPTDLESVLQAISSVSWLDLLNQALLSLIYPIYFVGPHHFQWPPVVDPISGPLAIVGLYLCAAGWRHSNSRFLLITFVVSAILIGGTSHYFRPPLTRLLFLSPFAALLAAIALDRLASTLTSATRASRLGTMLAVVMTTAAVVWSIGWTQYNVRYRYHGYGDGTTTELVRLALQQPDDVHFIYVQRKDTSMWTVDGVFDQYGLRERLSYFQGFGDEAKQALETRPPPFVAVLGLGDAEEFRVAEEVVARRFPEEQWKDSDAGEMWSLRYFVAE